MEDSYIKWLTHRLDKIEAMTYEHHTSSSRKLEELIVDVAVLQNEIKNSQEKHKRVSAMISSAVSIVFAAVVSYLFTR